MFIKVVLLLISVLILYHIFFCGNAGGFRRVNRTDGSRLPAYVILYTFMEELEWANFLDEETGVFRYCAIIGNLEII